MKDLVFSLLSGLNFWVVSGIVAASQIVDCEVTTSIFIDDGEGLVYQLQTSVVHSSSDSQKEFVIVDLARDILVEVLKEFLCLFFTYTSSKISQSIDEFVSVKSLGSVLISNLREDCKVLVIGGNFSNLLIGIANTSGGPFHS